MLSYALAIVVATSSLVLFLTAFLLSDIHRKDDFLWSGVGFIYALVLWFCARNITGAVLLGQAAATTLLVSYSWQTLKLRRAIANPERAADIYNFSVWQKINNLLKRNQTGLFKRNQSKAKPATSPVKTPVTPKVTEGEIAIPDTTSQDTENVEQAPIEATKGATQIDVSTAEPESVPKRSTIKKNEVTIDSKPVTPTENQVSETKEDTTDNQTSGSQELPPRSTEENRPDRATEMAKTTQVESRVEIHQDSSEHPTSPTDNSEPSSTAPTEPQVKPEESSIVKEAIAEEATKSQAQIPSLDVQPVSETVSASEKEAVKKASSLDSLETVEVAEVLEASSEDVSLTRETDSSNIIEVTTTEINITTEVKKIDPEPEVDPNPNPNPEAR